MRSLNKNIKSTLFLLLGLPFGLVISLCAMSSPVFNDKTLSLKEMDRFENIPDSINAILRKNQCVACHHEKERLVGPSFQQISGKGYSASEMVELIRNPKPSNWPGYPGMPPIQTITEGEMNAVAKWINSLNH